MTSTNARTGTLVYDGDCGFCTRFVNWATTTLPPSVRVVPSAAADLEGLGITVREADVAAWWIDPNGHRSRGHRAIAQVLIAMGGSWAVTGRMMTIPPVSWCAAAVYALVAKYRAHLPGGTASCALPRHHMSAITDVGLKSEDI